MEMFRFLGFGVFLFGFLWERKWVLVERGRNPVGWWVAGFFFQREKKEVKTPSSL